MNESITHVGIDAHKNSHTIAMLVSGGDDAVVWTIPNTAAAVRKMVRRIRKTVGDGEILCCYEAGVCGFTLARWIRDAGARCMVIAPTLVPVRPGRKVKTDRRDAINLATNLRAGQLVEVHPPDEQTEAVRDLVRLRQAAQADLHRTRQRLSKFLLRRGYVYSDGVAWTQKHLTWVDAVRFAEPADTLVMADLREELDHRAERVARLTREIESLAAEAPFAEPVGWLCCFRGIGTLTAMTLLTELHEFRRFATARQLMAYLGLTPSEASSGETVRRGPITKAGNRRVRMALTETAWHQGKSPRISKVLAKRREGQPAWVIRIADKAMRRLHRRYHRLLARGKMPPVANTAVSRELAGFIWAVLSPNAWPAEVAATMGS